MSKTIREEEVITKLKARHWQKIATAPKDETDILTIDQYGTCSVRCWGEGEDGENAWQPRIRGCFPQYWLPLGFLPDTPPLALREDELT